MTLDAVEFIRRFLLHVLPRGFVRFRSYGLLANRCRAERLARCRKLLGVEESTDATDPISTSATQDKAPPCPSCKAGPMIRFADCSKSGLNDTRVVLPQSSTARESTPSNHCDAISEHLARCIDSRAYAPVLWTTGCCCSLLAHELFKSPFIQPWRCSHC